MKNFQKSVTEYLEKEPRFRERVNKDRGIINLLARRMPYNSIREAMDVGVFTRQDLVAFCQDYAGMDRAWRKILEEKPRLRGNDYKQKERLEQEAQITLGYGQ